MGEINRLTCIMLNENLIYTLKLKLLINSYRSIQFIKMCEVSLKEIIVIFFRVDNSIQERSCFRSLTIVVYRNGRLR